ncbi:Gfo/Idh/MocA family oxidoreductase [Microbacterium sp. LMC-P-041]|uniref:Gfo/Idh/MocA family protein n=1 Tax=Microbacterium sp. LMC-P-041 TaxID=3040293 RepID=UPI0025542310|nr:Gfo/Idh/MocA family oxidoreductase [Microbacterium sp. LMC-P-041]
MKEFKVALIGGGGFMGHTHSMALSLAPLIADAGFTVTKQTLVDATDEVASAAAAKLGWNSSSTDWRSVIADPDIDAIDIVTPPPLHEEIAVAALAAGKHVFCEKPLANDLASAQRMAAAAASSAGVSTQVGFNYRHISAVQHIKALVERGDLGDVLQFRGTYLQDPLFFFDSFGWRGSKKTGGSGAVGDIGSHVLDLAEYICGPIVRVSASTRSLTRRVDARRTWADADEVREDERLDDSGVWVAEFASGAMGTFAVSFVSYGRKNRLTFEIDGERGSVDFDWNRPGEFQLGLESDAPDASGMKSVIVSGAHPDVWYPVAGLAQGYLDASAAQFAHFFGAIAAGTPTAPDFAVAAHTQAIVAAVTLSAERGGWVDVGEVSAS